MNENQNVKIETIENRMV